PMG
ncbi:30S ribosomal protein S1, partial [Chlamydia psittaci 03DC29]